MHILQATVTINLYFTGARGSDETSTAVAITCTIIIFVLLTLAALISYIVISKACPKKKVFLR